MKHIIITLAFFSTFSFCILGQESESSQTVEVVTAEGIKTVDVEQANKNVSNKLKTLREKQEKQKEVREEEKDNKRIAKIVGRIILGAIVFGGIAYWRNRKK